MPLDDLVSVIETIKQRIREHGDTLRQNETRTRMALIDPLLTALGWDVADPGLVTPEYDVSGKRADYALLVGPGTPIVFLEAKRLDEPLSSHRSQVVAYASELGIKYPALTNGNAWEVYDNSKLVPIDQRQILNVSLANAPTATSALQLLLLWRPNLSSGQPITANEPILSNGPENGSANCGGYSPPPPHPLPGDGPYTSLTELPSVKGTPPPSVIRLPTGEERPINYWWQVLF